MRPSTLPETLSEAALGHAGMGLSVLPLRERGKSPITLQGVKDAATDPEQIRRWWSRWPEANIGLAVPPGYLVLDLDDPEALGRLRARDLSLPTTATATTGRGQHFWYATGGVEVRNRVALLPGIDVRAPGGYVVAPPSIHPSGARYRWNVRLSRATVAEAPDWLLEMLSECPRSDPAGKRDWLRTIREPVTEGRRNQALAEVAGLLFRSLPADLAAELASCWAEVRLRPPLSDAEVRRTINSIAGCELRRRRGY